MRAFIGVLGALISVLGLFLAAGTHDGEMFFAGMVFFIFGIGLNFWLIGTADHGAGAAARPPAAPAE